MKEMTVTDMQQLAEDVQDILQRMEDDADRLARAIKRVGKQAPKECDWAIRVTNARAGAAEVSALILRLHADVLCGLAQVDPGLGNVVVARR